MSKGNLIVIEGACDGIGKTIITASDSILTESEEFVMCGPTNLSDNLIESYDKLSI